MREYERDLSKVITEGLRPNGRPQEDSLIKCFNGVPDPTGVRGYELPGMAVEESGGVCGCPIDATLDWPYPMIWQGAKDNYFATRDKLYILNIDRTVTELVDLVWARDFADFGDYVVFTGAYQVIVKDIHEGDSDDVTNYGPILASPSFPEFRTCCNFNGQLVIGNVTSNWSGARHNSVGWSNIGSADFTLGEMNEAGHMPMPWEGAVLKVKTLGKSVMVYGENGIGRIYPNEQTFGFENLLDVGLISFYAIAGDDHEHLFIDQDWNLWQIIEGEKPKKLNYQEWFGQMRPISIIGLFDPHNRDFYFSDETVTYVWRDGRLFEVGILPTAIMYSNGWFSGLYKQSPDDQHCGYTWCDLVLGIDTVNSRRRSIKTLTTLEVDADYSNELAVSAGYSYAHGEFTPFKWIDATQEGFARIQLTASDIQIRTKLINYEVDDKMVFITSSWQFPDNRYNRTFDHTKTGERS